MTNYKARAEIPDREWIEISLITNSAGLVEAAEIHALGCHELTGVLSDVQKALIGKPLNQIHWEGSSHADLLVSETFLKLQNKFELPVKEFELCHCRKIPTTVVDNAIVLGAHTPEKVRAWTSASSGCGTCRPEVEKLIQFRLKKMAS
jgi:bacterioferritin-associated ferredoxin